MITACVLIILGALFGWGWSRFWGWVLFRKSKKYNPPTRPSLRYALRQLSVWLVLLSLTATRKRRLIPFRWRAWLWEMEENRLYHEKA